MGNGKYQLLPSLSKDEYMGLKEDIAKMGVLMPVEFDEEGGVLDGHHRLKACRELGITEYPHVTREFKSEEEKRAHVYAVNIARRQLSSEQLKQIRKEQKKLAMMLRKQGLTQAEIAARLRVSQPLVSRWLQTTVPIITGNNRHIQAQSIDIPDVRITIPKSGHYLIYERSKRGETQEEIAADYKVDRSRISRIIKKEHEKIAKKEQLVQAGVSGEYGGGYWYSAKAGLDKLLETKQRFGTIYIDPPWKYSNQSTRASTDNHYATMTIEEIADLPVKALAEDKCHLHLWTTNAFLFETKALLEKWGFEYKSVFIWVKPQIGIGNYWRVSHEFLILGVRGGLTFLDNSLCSWLESPRTKHSQKPDDIRAMLEKASPVPRLEMFARAVFPGWHCWGDEVAVGLFDKEG